MLVRFVEGACDVQQNQSLVNLFVFPTRGFVPPLGTANGRLS